ncbi:MAG: DUF1343 domain-containing protein [Dysgonamonadaceae bacterium]|jgi:uncharacterized protein YbbC (DUF1343 family)|nr:DUF1343 domain-containing protein [Dysgonamonadaceae bacterium]
MKRQILIMIGIAFFISGVSAQKVKTGIEQLKKEHFKSLEGKRVGLITNPTGVDADLRSTIDILFEAPNVQLVALYAPEHGVRGDIYAGDKVTDENDPTTGLPVFSLYGKTRKPSPEMLEGIDVLVYDIQDIGSRSYTFISTLGLAMEAAAENNIELVVLDRPNPLGGKKMEGAVTKPEFVSFVSQYPIPYIHGLTCGELANYLNNEGLLANGVKCKLSVVKMKGWKRDMNFQATGLPWVPSSPHIPHAETAYFYPISGIVGELSGFSIGVGYTMPFELFAAPWIESAELLAKNLNDLHLPGIVFRPIHYKPYYSHFKSETVHGVHVHIIDYRKAPLSIVQFYVLQELHKLYPDQNLFDEKNEKRFNMFDKVCGTDEIRMEFTKRFLVEDILPLWNDDVKPFQQRVKPYLIYR